MPNLLQNPDETYDLCPARSLFSITLPVILHTEDGDSEPLLLKASRSVQRIPESEKCTRYMVAIAPLSGDQNKPPAAKLNVLVGAFLRLKPCVGRRHSMEIFVACQPSNLARPMISGYNNR